MGQAIVFHTLTVLMHPYSQYLISDPTEDEELFSSATITVSLFFDGGLCVMWSLQVVTDPRGVLYSVSQPCMLSFGSMVPRYPVMQPRQQRQPTSPAQPSPKRRSASACSGRSFTDPSNQVVTYTAVLRRAPKRSLPCWRPCRDTSRFRNVMALGHKG